MQPAMQFLHLPDARKLACYSWDSHQHAKAVLCMHGFTRNGRDFEKLACHLSDYYRVFCPDMAGRGRSDWLKDPALYNYTTYLADIGVFFQQLELTSVDWIGTSMGGILGMMVAATQPERVKRLVLNDVGAFIPRQGLIRIGGYVGKDMEFSSPEEAAPILKERYVDFGIEDEADWRRLINGSLEALPDGRVRLAYDPAIGNAFTDPGAIQDVDLWSVWERTTCPVLILRGAHSDILLHETATKMQSKAPERVTYMEIPNAGHAPSLMGKDEIALIRRWLMDNRLS